MLTYASVYGTELTHATWLKSRWKKHTETQRELTHVGL